jgi:hypothetical protein
MPFTDVRFTDVRFTDIRKRHLGGHTGMGFFEDKRFIANKSSVSISYFPSDNMSLANQAANAGP